VLPLQWGWQAGTHRPLAVRSWWWCRLPLDSVTTACRLMWAAVSQRVPAGWMSWCLFVVDAAPACCRSCRSWLQPRVSWPLAGSHGGLGEGEGEREPVNVTRICVGSKWCACLSSVRTAQAVSAKAVQRVCDTLHCFLPCFSS